MLTVDSIAFVFISSVLAGLFMSFGFMYGGIKEKWDGDRIFYTALLSSILTFLLFFCITLIVALLQDIPIFLSIFVILALLAVFVLSNSIGFAAGSEKTKKHHQQEKKTD